MYVLNNNVTYFDSFGVERIPIITNIFRIKVCDSIMRGYFCIGFIDFMFKGKSLTDFTNLFTNFFSPNNLKKNGDIILNYFKDG